MNDLIKQQKALKVLEEPLDDDPENPILHLNMELEHRDVGEIQIARGNAVEAGNSFRRALEVMQKLDEEDVLGERDKKQITELQTKLINQKKKDFLQPAAKNPFRHQ